MDEKTKQKSEEMLNSIRVTPREFIEFQLECEFGLEDLRALMQLLDCPLDKLVDAVARAKGVR